MSDETNLFQYASVLIAILAACGVGMLIILFFFKAKGDFEKKPILTENEKEFFFRMRKAVPELFVFPQMSMGAIMDATEKDDGRRRMQIRSRFSQKIVDFVVTDRDLEIIALVELDDRTHDPEKDAKRDAMTSEAGYVTIRWDSRSKPSIAEIRETFRDWT